MITITILMILKVMIIIMMNLIIHVFFFIRNLARVLVS